ncbi:MAG: hypothetical protein WA459_23455 [Stellaceae bacterium]
MPPTILRRSEHAWTNYAASVIRYWPTRRGVRRSAQGRIIGLPSATLRINRVGSCRVQSSGHLSGKLGLAVVAPRFLFYVAGTRARYHLLVTDFNPASEFLNDLTG